jgi:tryptophan-rich sensory protein
MPNRDRGTWLLGSLVPVALPVLGIWLLGQLATFPNLVPWYQGLLKPSFNPPNWMFGPVWTTLYVLMAYAGWRVIRLPVSEPGRTRALVLFYLQLLLNGAWSWMFFALNSPAAGLVNIIPQSLLIAGAIAAFRKLDPLAAWCLVPLAAWVGFAAVLNFEIWRLNG